MRQILHGAIFIALLACACTLPVRDTSDDMSLPSSAELKDSAYMEHTLNEINDDDVPNFMHDISASNSVEQDQREKRLVVDIVQDDNEASNSNEQDAEDKTLLKLSAKQRAKRSTESDSSEEADHKDKHAEHKHGAGSSHDKSKSSEESNEHGDHQHGDEHNKVRRKRTSTAEHTVRMHGATRKRGAPVDNSAKRADSRSEEVSVEKLAKVEDSAAEVQDDDIALEPSNERASDEQPQQQKQREQNLDESADIIAEPDTLDYVQGCEVMEANSYEANETTYFNEKR